MTTQAPPLDDTTIPDQLRKLLFVTIIVVQFLVVVDASIVFIALPSIGADLGFSVTELAWVIDAYTVAFAGFMLLGGRLADVFGRRTTLLLGLVLFGFGSLGSGIALTPMQLIAARGIQGFGAAIVSPAALALIVDIFPPGPDRFRALGIFGGIGGFAGASGALIGGLLAELTWRLAFLINVPVLIAVLIFALRSIPTTTRSREIDVDWLGASLATGGLTLVLIGVLRGSTQGWASTSTLVQFAAGAAALVLLVVRQLKASDPLIPRQLFGHLNVVRGNLANIFVGALLFGVFFVLSLYLQQVRGLSPFQAGLLIAPVSLSLLAGSLAAHRLIKRITPPLLLVTGLGIQAVGLAATATSVSLESAPLATTVVASMIWGLGSGLAIVSAFVVCTAGLFGPIMGSASGLVSTTLQVGGAIGVAVLGVLAFSHGVEESFVPTHDTALWGAAAAAVAGLLVAATAQRGWDSVEIDPGHHEPETASAQSHH